MKINELPESIEDSRKLADKLTIRIENEPDKERRRELFLLQMELRDHILQLELSKKKVTV